MMATKITNVNLVSFSDAGDLKRHIHTVHEGHKDHKCEFCGKSFATAHSLKTHIITIHERIETGNV